MKVNIFWNFHEGQLVQIKRTKIVGMITERWLRYGWPVYLVKLAANGCSFVYHTNELMTTKARIKSNVSIKELKHKDLTEGTYCKKTKIKKSKIVENWIKKGNSWVYNGSANATTSITSLTDSRQSSLFDWRKEVGVATGLSFEPEDDANLVELPPIVGSKMVKIGSL